MWLKMPTKITAGVSSDFGVTASAERSAALMKPVCSATPRPSIATSTTPSGGNDTKVCTICAMNPVKLAPDSRLFTTIGLPLRGSMASKVTPDSAHDTAQTSSINSRKSTAGSGRRLPTRSTRSSERTIQPRGAATSEVAGVMRAPVEILVSPES